MSLLSITKKILQQEDKGKKKEKKAAPKKEEIVANASNTSILAGQIGLSLMMSEKSFNKQDLNTAVFRVIPDASKGQIAAAVQEKYKVKPLKVRTMRFKPKNRRRGATVGKTASWKKAYVTVEDLSAINTAP